MADHAANPTTLRKIAQYLETLDQDPASPVFVPLSEAYRKMGLLDYAREVAERGIQVLPSLAAGYVALGRVQEQQGNSSEALNSFSRAVDLDSTNFPALKDLGRLLAREGKKSKALAALEKADSVRPGDPTVKRMVAALRRGEEQAPATVISSPPKAVSPPSPPPAGAPISTPTIAEIYVKQGFYKRALKIYRDILQVDPHNEEIRQKLVDLKERISESQKFGQSEEAIGMPPVAPPEPDSIAPSGSSPQNPTRVNSSPSERREEILLGTYNRWLEAIRLRRAHVQ